MFQELSNVIKFSCSSTEEELFSNRKKKEFLIKNKKK